ncbi:MAG: hypothetical protein KBB78_03460, partial [Candidatus Pacebacteria bacterium]|nr:hypothetical protein [Candidatus Paceibacterota bacterium]
MLISSPLYFDVLPAQSSDPRELTFGEQQTTNIFPTSAHTDDWGDVENVLTQDLSDHALYQDFSEENSASISEHSQEIDRGESFLDTASSTDVSQEPVTEVQSSTEAVETIEATEPSSEMEESASELPVSLFYEPPFLEARTFEEATKLYPLAHLVMTSSTEDMAHDHEVIEESVETDTVSIDDQTVVTEPVVDNDQTVTFAELSAQDTEEVHQLTLENFSVGSLEPGHFVDAMQLRLSFAANPVGESSPAPYVDVFFGDDGAMRQVGYILLDEEASNAINGGYYLFALPAFMLVDELDEAKVVIRYHGTKAQVEDVFVDAAWLEMTTRIITAEDLEERGTAEQLTHLDAPDISVLLSDQLNFDVTDEPLFNLRYETQQNFLVRGFLKLIGKGSFG